jgi:Ser/Thr protein kinase RdoA (MazF antagonist)
MFRRQGVDTLSAHLEEVFGVAVSRVQQLDVGVFRVDRLKGTPMVARLFSARRAHAAVLGDLAVLAPKSDWPAGDRVVALGALVGRLHRLARPAGAADRPAGALHHYAEGTPADELHAARRWLRDIEPRVAAADRDQLDLLRRALAEADDATGLPEAFVHPDPVPKNTVFTKDGPVLVDWAGAGRGPRLASLALVLRSSWAGPRFMRGYATSVELEAEERRRAPDVLMTRALIDIAFRVCREPAKVRLQVKRLPAVRKRTGALAAAALAAA